MNVENFYDNIGQNWDLHSDILRDYIFANISVGLVRTQEMKNDIDRLYVVDKLRYYDAAKNSTCMNHVIMLQGSLEQEIYARKVLGILLIAEEEYVLRSKVIKLLRKYYPLVYRSVKKLNNRELIGEYLRMDDLTMRTERRLHSAIYLYLVRYCSSKEVDRDYIFSVMNDIKNYELSSPMTTNIDKELEYHKSEIQKIKLLIEKEYGKLYGYKDVLNTDNNDVDDIGCVLKNLFMINKIDVDQIFDDFEALNIDSIILSYIKCGYKKLEPNIILQALVNGIFMQSMINEYKKSRRLYFENNQETVYFKLHSLEEKLKSVENENKEITTKMASLQQEKMLFDETLNNEINKLNKAHKSEIVHMEKIIKKLEKQLEEEERYRNELNILREYIFEAKNEYVPNNSDKTLDYYIANKRILIIGGAKDWRRKFKEKYPEIQTLNGFNDNFETSILNNVDCIFFYTGFMSHSTYNRAMKFIRTNQVKFGYIGKTNIDLVEEEIIEELKKCKIGRRLNLSD